MQHRRFHICRRIKQNFFEQRREDRMQSSCTDIFDLLVHVGCHPGNFSDAVVCEFERDTLGREKSSVLFEESILRNRQDLYEILFGQTVQLDTNGEAALEFRY